MAKVWDRLFGVFIEGPWRNFNSLPGEEYSVTTALESQKKWLRTYGADGLTASGATLLFNPSNQRVVQSLDGTYETFFHPFGRGNMSVLKTGSFRNGLGFLYEGSFEYLPAKEGFERKIASGYYIFYGKKTDTQTNESDTGMYLSTLSMLNMPINFRKVDETALAVFQKKYHKDLGEANEYSDGMATQRAFAKIFMLFHAIASGGAIGSSGTQVGLSIAKELLTSSDSTDAPKNASGKTPPTQQQADPDVLNSIEEAINAD